MAIDPQLLAQLQRQAQQGDYYNMQGGFAPTGIVHAGEDAGMPSQLLGFGGNYTGMTPGSSYDLYGTNGEFAGRRKVEDGGSTADLLRTSFSDLGPAMAMIAAGYGVGSLLNGGFLPFGGGGGAAGFAGDATAVGYDPMFGAATSSAPNTAVMGSGAGFGSGSIGSGLTEAGSSLSKAALDGTNVFGANSIPGALDISSLVSAAPGAASASALADIAKTAGYTSASSAADWMKTALKYGMPAIGGLLGSQGIQKSSTKTEDLPEWLKPFVQKELGYAGGLLDHQMTPEYQQGYEQVRNTALGLLSRPMQGNGFSLFFPNAAQGLLASPPRLGSQS